METNEPVIPMTPPTDPVPIERAKLRSSWPGVLGTIAIVFGALGMLGGVLALLGPMVTPWMRLFGGAEAEMAISIMEKWEWWTYTSTGVTVVVAALLLVGGIGLVRRRAWSGRVLLTWAGIKFVWGAVSMAVGAMIQLEVHAAQPPAPGMPPGMMKLILAGSMLFGFAWVSALPVFTLIWLTRRKVRAEVRSWGTRSAAAA